MLVELSKALRAHAPRHLTKKDDNGGKSTFADLRLTTPSGTIDLDLSITKKERSQIVYSEKIKKHTKNLAGKKVEILPVIVHNDMTMHA